MKLGRKTVVDEVKIRDAGKNDKDKVAKVMFASGLAKTEEVAPRIFLHELKKGDRYLLAENSKGDPLGIISSVLHGEPRHGLAEIYHVAVLPEVMGTDVATRLFNAMVKKLDYIFSQNSSRLRKLYLLTHADNERAHGFYAKMGMIHEATLASHFRKGLDEYVFSKFFDGEEEDEA